ncbi:DNA-binding response OmpR family regulator [Arthrobacter sp. UYCo732]
MELDVQPEEFFLVAALACRPQTCCERDQLVASIPRSTFGGQPGRL